MIFSIVQANEGEQAPPTEKLGDFKIKKYLDGGAFGKVFLVVNMKDGKEYAMKRINKDALIEKDKIVEIKARPINKLK